MPAAVFIAVVALTTVVELIASYLLEWTTGGWLWDYTRYAIQWQGRICLSASLRFGVAGMLVLYAVQPLLERGVARLGARRRAVFAVLFAVFAADCLLRPAPVSARRKTKKRLSLRRENRPGTAVLDFMGCRQNSMNDMQST